MKILLVGDNIGFPNWGGRGAAIALRRILSASYDVFASIAGTEFEVKLVNFSFVQPRFLDAQSDTFHLAVKNRHTGRLIGAFVRIMETLGARDFVSEDSKETAKTILKFKSKYHQLEEIYQKVLRADIILVNGEGDFVFSDPPRRQVLYMLGIAELGLSLGKHVVFANGMLSACVTTGTNSATIDTTRRIFQQLSAVIVRDAESYAYAQRQSLPVSAIVPDSLFAFYPAVNDASSTIPRNGDFVVSYPEYVASLGRLDFHERYVCVLGGAAPAKDIGRAIPAYVRLVHEVAKVIPNIILVETCAGDRFLRQVASESGFPVLPANISVYMGAKILANAVAVLSGRYHPSILASLGGTPCVFLRSTAHKMLSVQELLGYGAPREFDSFPNTTEVAQILDQFESYLRDGERLREHLKRTAEQRYRETIQLPNVLSGLSRANGSQLA